MTLPKQLKTTGKQQKAVIKTMQITELKAIVQVLYNVVANYDSLSNHHKRKLRVNKRIILQFVKKRTTNVCKENNTV